MTEWMMGKTECWLIQCQVSPLADLPNWIVYLFKWRTNVNVIKIMCQRLIFKHPVVIIMIGQWLLVEHCYALSMWFTWYWRRSWFPETCALFSPSDEWSRQNKWRMDFSLFWQAGHSEAVVGILVNVVLIRRFPSEIGFSFIHLCT